MALDEEHAARLWRELVDGSVECELCNNPYDESDAHAPRLLACGHTFCQSCLADWSAFSTTTTNTATNTANTNTNNATTNNASSMASIECPTCRRVTTFAARDGPRALPKNFELLRVRQEIEAHSHVHLHQLKQAWTTQIMEKETNARAAEAHAMAAQRESVQAAQRAMHLTKQVEINEQEKRHAQEMAEDARRKALVASQHAEALQAETERLKQRLHQEAVHLQGVKRDASSAAAEAKELYTRAEALEQQVECVRAQLSLHAGRHDPSKLVVLVVEPTTVGSWLLPYTRYAVISIAKHPGSKQQQQNKGEGIGGEHNALDPFHAAKTWVTLRHVAAPSSSVKVYRRYSDFVWLHHELHRQFPFEVVPSIPGKQLFFNKDKEFVGDRMRALQAFVREILRHPVLATTEFVRAFLLSTTEELENLRNAARLRDDDDDSFLHEVEASEAAATTSRQDSLVVTSPTTTTPVAAASRSSWAWGAVSALTSSATKLVTSTGSALTSGISVASSTTVGGGIGGVDDPTEKSLSSSLTISDEETQVLSTASRHAIEKRRMLIDVARAHQSVTSKGAHVARSQRRYAHHLHRLCELMHRMDALDQDYARRKHDRAVLAASTMEHSSTYTARQVEEDARACLESERPFQEKASEVFSALSLATSNDAECMEYALLEISRMQTLHLGAIEDAFARLRKKEDALAQASSGSLSSATMESSSAAYGSSLSSSVSSMVLAKREELQARRQELMDKVHGVDPARAKLVLETLQQNVKEMHTLAVARRKLHESSYQQLLAACRAV